MDIWKVSTGNTVPGHFSNGASPNSLHTGSASKVADMINIFKSGRSSAWLCRASANPKSACRLRS
ncbi:hypothetical protein JOD82_001528 [Paenibacillus sp. 1182]|nr:hypothetical protein [Paenibacillus sp. 1182]